MYLERNGIKSIWKSARKEDLGRRYVEFSAISFHFLFQIFISFFISDYLCRVEYAAWKKLICTALQKKKVFPTDFVNLFKFDSGFAHFWHRYSGCSRVMPLYKSCSRVVLEQPHVHFKIIHARGAKCWVQHPSSKHGTLIHLGQNNPGVFYQGSSSQAKLGNNLRLLRYVRENQGEPGKIREHFLQSGKMYVFPTKSGNFYFSWMFVKPQLITVHDAWQYR